MRNVTPIILIIMLVASLGLAACGSDDADSSPESVKIAVSVPLALDIGQDVVDALEMALEERDGAVDGVEVSLLVLNSSDPEGSPVSPDVEETIAQQAVEDDAVVAYIGPMTTDQAKASIPILNEASIAQITESATWPGLTKPGFGPGEPGIYYPTGQRTFFRVLPADDVQAIGGARWMVELGHEAVFVVSDGTSYGDGISGIFSVAAQDVGLNIVRTAQLAGEASGADDIAAVLDEIADVEPDIVYFGGGVVPNGVRFIAALREANPAIPVMGTDGLFQQELIDEVGAGQVEGIYVTNPIVPVEELSTAAAFAEQYEERYGSEPLPYVLTAYAALESVLTAIEAADEVTREGVLDALADLNEISGVFGTWAFDPNGDTTYGVLSGWTIAGGEWTFVTTLDSGL